MPNKLPSALEIRFRLLRDPKPAQLKARIRARLLRAIGHWATAIRYIDVRFEDVNGPRGGNDIRCSLLVGMNRADDIVVKVTSTTQRRAFALAAPKLERAVRRDLGRRGISAGRVSMHDPVRTRRLPAATSLIGRREGRADKQLALALARPEKERRDAYTDTAEPDVSESDRRAGGGHSARRNSRKVSSGHTVTLEDSLGRPSRKSTRRSSNRGKPSDGKARAAVARSFTPSARARH